MSSWSLFMGASLHLLLACFMSCHVALTRLMILPYRPNCSIRPTSDSAALVRALQHLTLIILVCYMLHKGVLVEFGTQLPDGN